MYIVHIKMVIIVSFILEQKLSDIPSSVLSDIVMCLNNPSPLGNNWRALADELLLSYQTVQSLDYHGPGGMMAGVLEIMFHRKVTVGKFKQLLEKMERLDVIEILIKAGFPANTICENETGMVPTAFRGFSVYSRILR